MYPLLFPVGLLESLIYLKLIYSHSEIHVLSFILLCVAIKFLKFYLFLDAMFTLVYIFIIFIKQIRWI